jgi:hypothetical protein
LIMPLYNPLILKVAVFKATFLSTVNDFYCNIQNFQTP